ncbi:prolyl oligopeptidase family serine peptidase, partial [Mariniblastus sp.]|nr:prolyl oligopeptidase family serine peptidase [Mariniblastus sp.]
MKRTLSLLFSAACLSLPSVCVAQHIPAPVVQPVQIVAERSVPIFKDGLAQVVPGFSNPADWIVHDLWVETEFDSDMDGTNDRMHVSVCRQKQTDTQGLKVPVIYNTSPYFCGIGSESPKYMWNPETELNVAPPKHENPPPIPQQSKRPAISKRKNKTWVPRGYAVVYSSSPGTGLSDGCPTVGGDNESLAPKAVIDWLCGRAMGFSAAVGGEPVTAYWCSGKVGMTGTSYEGTLPIAAATTGVEGLAAIIPDAPNTSYYHYYRSNGLVRHPGGYMGEDVDVLYNFIHSGAEENCLGCNERVRDGLMAANQDRITGDYNDFWKGRNYLNKLDNYTTPTLLSHGLGDWNVMPGHSIRVFEALTAKSVPCQMYLHQNGHGGPPPLKIMNRWFSHYLHGVDNGVENDPALYVVRERNRRDSPTQYKTFPNPDAKPVTFSLDTGGQQIGGLTLEPTRAKATESFTDDASIT